MSVCTSIVIHQCLTTGDYSRRLRPHADSNVRLGVGLLPSIVA